MMTIEDVKPYCDMYGYQTRDMFGQVHIKTKYERWYFESNDEPNARVRLMHGNRIGDGWHEQFRDDMSAEELIMYIHEHETAKFEHFVGFHFGKTGGLFNPNHYVFQKFCSS